jgi:hypothetical protein
MKIRFGASLGERRFICGMTSVLTQPRRRLSRDERELLRKLISDARRVREEARREGRHNVVRR